MPAIMAAQFKVKLVISGIIRIVTYSIYPVLDVFCCRLAVFNTSVTKKIIDHLPNNIATFKFL